MDLKKCSTKFCTHMPGRTEKKEAKLLCVGGESYKRKRTDHEQGREVRCYRCNTVMGCVWCCESAQELVCLRCQNWALKKGVERHGDVMPNFKVQHVRTDRGWRHYDATKDSPIK